MVCHLLTALFFIESCGGFAFFAPFGAESRGEILRSFHSAWGSRGEIFCFRHSAIVTRGESP